ncbi:MAG: IS200/IS605 family transposase [Elusimicrobiota bacterium]|jgi:REP element-mobilizing transposase RayT|nr:IS200/IS605 family transposase [Elusimicrobiota bacterium]
MSYKQILYHIVFGTKSHRRVLTDINIKELYLYIGGIIKNKGCNLYKINGMPDHIHILSDLNPMLSLSDFIKEIKRCSSIWIKESRKFINFDGWADGYCALTYAYSDKDIVEQYIANQQEHHKKTSFRDEFIALLKENHIEFDEKYII